MGTLRCFGDCIMCNSIFGINLHMRIGIISDIHSNPTALLTVLKDIEQQKCDRIVCLGDIVGYGYDPNGCIDICRERGIECFLGNHDAGLVGKFSLDQFIPFAKNAILRQRALVSEENKRWLENLPYNKMEGKEDNFAYAFVHGTYCLPERFDYINWFTDAVLELQYLKAQKINVLFVGHTHQATLWLFNGDYSRVQQAYIDLDDNQEFDLSADAECAIVNVGSVGYPRVQPYSIYGIYDTETHIFQHRILPFDFNDYAHKMLEANAEIPLWLESRRQEAERHPVLWK